jgi:predicted CXXCH cytochrome family protein
MLGPHQTRKEFTMKAKVPILVGVTAATVGLFAVTITGQNAPIAGSAHDFSAYGWSNNQICLPCHTPHGADTTVDRAPLWNHELTQATYIMYDGSTAPWDEALDPGSILCMSCHDGTVALDSFGGKSGSVYIGGNGLLGTDLRDDHPVGATAVYPDQGPNTRMHPASNWEHPNSPGRMFRQEMEINGELVKVIGCNTCHNVHNTVHPYMLRQTNDGSNLCLLCHIK